MDSRPEASASQTDPARALAWAGLLLAVLFVVVNSWLVLAGGPVRFGGDSPRYVDGAEELLAGRLPTGKAWSYSGYVGLVALGLASGTGTAGVIVVQILVAGLAALALMDLGRKLAGLWAGLLASGTFIANPDIVRWHTFLLTDSLYTSSVVGSVWAIHWAGERGRLARLLLAMSVVTLTALLRPNGWVLLPMAGIYWICLFFHSWQGRWLLVSTVVLAFLLSAVLIPAFRQGIQAERPEVMLLQGEVVWGYREWRLSMPADPLPENGWTGALGYIARHPLACLRLAGARVLAELAHARPFYSFAHNAAILVTLPIAYILASLALVRFWNEPLARLLAAVIAAHLLTVALTFADWDGRFLLYILPLIGILAASAVMPIRTGSSTP